MFRVVHTVMWCVCVCRSVRERWIKASPYASSSVVSAGEAAGHAVPPVADSVTGDRTSAGSGAHLPRGGAAEPGSCADEWPERPPGVSVPLGALPFSVHCEFLSTHLSLFYAQE